MVGSCLEGVEVPAWVIEHPEWITASTIADTFEPALRNTMIDIMTPERFIAPIAWIADTFYEAPLHEPIDHACYGTTAQMELSPNISGCWRTLIHDKTKGIQIAGIHTEPPRNCLGMTLFRRRY